ncbi:LPS assembly lipoprotein LptE [Methylophaga sp. OBS3]|uniref:LPS-assembly lipoprotein LptE n=1 Tax=Methylophaga sp. OBS3 TaxID=2991934 RepID=UPI002253AEA3|nr:LPS assembly lipoprotein LptE [Methylophaga sp. OBS3]MCX4190112.1 LPS assembly lipoprotein LptE [Methylophaga sp. OBS3]
MQIKQVFKLSLVSILAAMLMACGFQLRGAASVPDTVKTIYIQGVNIRDEFGLNLKRTLTRNGITVVSDYREGAALMSFTRNRLQRRVMTVGVQTAKVAEYELILEVEFDVSDANQNKLIENEFFEARRDYQFDPQQMLGRDAEEELLRQEMYEQLSQAILRRLSALD